MDRTVLIFSLLGSSSTGFALYQIIPQILQLQKKYIQYSQMIEFTPTTLLNFFNQTQTTTIEAFIAGELISDNPIISKLPLIISEKKSYITFENGAKNIIKTIYKEASQFSIKDHFNQIEVRKNSNLIYQFSMNHIWDKYIPKQLSIIQRLTNFVLATLNLIKLKKQFLNGFQTGLLEREYGIIAKEFYVIYGEIILDKTLNKMFIQNPKYILKSKIQLLRLIKEQMQSQRATIAILFLLFSIWALILGCNIKQYIFKLLKERQKARLDKLRGQKYLEINDQECQICYERPRNIVIKPCKHFTICHVCLQRLKQPQCPICKEQIKDYIEINFT